MKKLFILICALVPLMIYGQEEKKEFDGHAWEAPYNLAIPAGWTIERFLVPISFAPEIPYKGVEDIRFAPGWGKSGSEEYWSYAFLWYLDGSPKIDAGIIAANLKAYYTGLLAVNTEPIKLKAIPDSLKQAKTSFREMQTSPGDVKTFRGTVQMLDYMQLKPVVLNCTAHLRICEQDNKTILFFQLSPQAYTHKIWESFQQLWVDFKCRK
jgi:hypothetical protein